MDRFSELKAFCLVAACGGFSPAARQLGVATSSVTRLVDALEQRLGAPLLNRSTRRVTLTDSGQQYYDSALAILSQLEAADDTATAHQGEAAGLLRVTAPVTFSTLYIAPLLGELARRHPRLQLELQLSDTVSNMVDDAIDVAIRIGTAQQQPNLIARRLGGHRRVICASPAYLREHGTPRQPSDLLGHNCLLFSYGGTRRGWRLREPACDGQGSAEPEACIDLPVRGTLAVNNSEVLRRAVLDGVGLAMLPEWLVRADLASGALLPVLSRYQANPGEMDIALYAMYAANRRGSVKIKALVDLLAERLPADG
ncbi:LysR family transcriptional regulator [Oxalobacteraceae bacterium A2-2]